MTHLTRRGLLATAGVGAAALAGCSGGNGGGDQNENSTTGTPTDGPRLQHIDLINRDDEPHTVHVQIERGDDVVYWDVYDLAAADEGESASRLIEQSWDAGGPFTIEARVDSGNVRTQTYETAESDCIGVFAPITDGRLSFYDGAADCGGGATTTR